jgi:hypothetical protein
VSSGIAIEACESVRDEGVGLAGSEELAIETHNKASALTATPLSPVSVSPSLHSISHYHLGCVHFLISPVNMRELSCVVSLPAWLKEYSHSLIVPSLLLVVGLIWATNSSLLSPSRPAETRVHSYTVYTSNHPHKSCSRGADQGSVLPFRS